MSRSSPKRRPARELKCKDCGADFSYTPGDVGGRPPTRCEAHRRTGPRTTQNPEANRRRKNARREAKRAAVSIQATAGDLHRAVELAHALRLYADPQTAGQYLGIPDDEISRIHDLAQTSCADLLSDAPAATLLRLEVASGLMAEQAVFERSQMAPRDLPHVGRALAQTRAILAESRGPSYASVTVTLGPIAETGGG